MAKTSPFKSPKKHSFKTFSWTAKTCSYYTCRTKSTPLLILDEAVEGLDDENVAVIAQLIPFYQQTNIAILYILIGLNLTLFLTLFLS
jgi:ABC-type molybdenum transport system ATPase subunit/photorepair protein PhrA